MAGAPTAERGLDAERLGAVTLAAGRLAIGGGLWFAPDPAIRALGFDPPNAQTLALARVAATRDLVIGGWQLAVAGDPARRRHALVAGIACDAGDAFAFALLAKQGGGRAGPRGVASAAAATVLGLWLALRSQRS